MSEESVRKLLRQKCEESSMGQREIAKRAGIGQANLSRYLLGKGGMRSANLDALLAVFDLELHHRKLRKKKG